MEIPNTDLISLVGYLKDIYSTKIWIHCSSPIRKEHQPDANRYLCKVPINETQMTGKEGAWKTERSSMSSSSSSSTLPLNSIPPSVPPCSSKSSASRSSSVPTLLSESCGVKGFVQIDRKMACGYACGFCYSPALELSAELAENCTGIDCRKTQLLTT